MRRGFGRGAPGGGIFRVGMVREGMQEFVRPVATDVRAEHSHQRHPVPYSDPGALTPPACVCGALWALVDTHTMF